MSVMFVSPFKGEANMTCNEWASLSHEGMFRGSFTALAARAAGAARLVSVGYSVEYDGEPGTCSHVSGVRWKRLCKC